jgi:hypothetical protein
MLLEQMKNELSSSSTKKQPNYHLIGLQRLAMYQQGYLLEKPGL